jgi:hypothetical protein
MMPDQQNSGGDKSTLNSSNHSNQKPNSLKHLLVSGAIVIALTSAMSLMTQRQMTQNVGKPAPLFTLPAPDGRPVALQDAINGRKAVLVNFWFYS